MNPKDFLPTETIGKIYDDAISPFAKQVGALGGDVGKTARLVLFPLQFVGLGQDSLERMLKRISERVPEDKQVESPPEIVGPVLEGIRYQREGSTLWQMFEEVLTRSVDAESVGRVHPSFAHLIPQLSRDEAWILFRLREEEFTTIDKLDFDERKSRFCNRQVVQRSIPLNELHAPPQEYLCYSHLLSMSLIEWPVINQEPLIIGNKQTEVRRTATLKLTDFGRLFAEATIPKGGFQS